MTRINVDDTEQNQNWTKQQWDFDDAGDFLLGLMEPGVKTTEDIQRAVDRWCNESPFAHTMPEEVKAELEETWGVVVPR